MQTKYYCNYQGQVIKLIHRRWNLRMTWLHAKSKNPGAATPGFLFWASCELQISV